MTESQSLPQPESHCLDSFEVAEIRHALQRYQAISALLRPAIQAEPPTLSQVERQVTYAWLSFQGARYAVLGQVIPRGDGRLGPSREPTPPVCRILFQSARI